MWKLLPVILLASCAANEPTDSVSSETPRGSYRIVGTLDAPLYLSPSPGSRGTVTKEFPRNDTRNDRRGWLQDTGAWNISAPVAHPRLRCATYETGIQLGQGNPACSDVQWLANVQFRTRPTHCGAATPIHTGGGEFAAMNDIFEASAGERVATRCDGAC